MNTKSINNFMPSKYHISFTIFITQEFGPMEDFFKQHFAQHKIQTEMHGGVFNFGSDIHFANIFEVTKLDPMQFYRFYSPLNEKKLSSIPYLKLNWLILKLYLTCYEKIIGKKAQKKWRRTVNV